jgi:hypothetical protein
VIAVIDEWWGGRPMAGMLPRLFFDHFTCRPDQGRDRTFWMIANRRTLGSTEA